MAEPLYMSFDPGFRGKYLLSIWVEDLSNLACSKSLALPVRPLDCVRAVLATAENITKQEIIRRLTKRLRLRIFGVPLSRSDLTLMLAPFKFFEDCLRQGLTKSRPTETVLGPD